jgi:hypothetical protein
VDTLASNNIPLRVTSCSISFIFDQPIINFKQNNNKTEQTSAVYLTWSTN